MPIIGRRGSLPSYIPTSASWSGPYSVLWARGSEKLSDSQLDKRVSWLRCRSRRPDLTCHPSVKVSHGSKLTNMSTETIVPDVAFSREQKEYLQGYFAGLALSRNDTFRRAFARRSDDQLAGAGSGQRRRRNRSSGRSDGLRNTGFRALRAGSLQASTAWH